ncbi:type II toxin-antitoxin system RelE/ParE family toxin [Niabella sp.]|uniref:type II toxin-antitoxin system RelE/ParE family toxin n=1 Tax=Niabella sp. TaxID=1962976 RepID=UPI00345193C1
MGKRQITWTKNAARQFESAIKYIRNDSHQHAESVKTRILEKVHQLSDATLVHRKDPFKKNNDGSFRYFEILKYRIVYYIKQNEVFIIRLRHTSMEPKKY